MEDAVALGQATENRHHDNWVALGHRAIHVWPVRLEAAQDVVATFQQVLSPDEATRAARFSFDHLQRRFVLARSALRLLLGRYLHTEANRIQFHYGANGKPWLPAAADIQFNASHSGSIALLAFTLQCAIGIDTEQIRPLPNSHMIADRFFCAEEAAELRSLPAAEREHAFLLCWTRKEAYLKAVGGGLSAPLDCFRVSLRPGEPARFIHFAHGITNHTGWTLHDLSSPPRYAAALAYDDTPRSLHIRPLTDPVQLLERIALSNAEEIRGRCEGVTG